MKKISTLLLLFVAFAVNAMAEEKSYTDDLYVTINGETAGPMEATITVTDQEDGNYTLSLKNFILSSGGEDLAVGNITIADVPVTEETATYKVLSKDTEIMIEAGDDPNVDFWMGPMICEAVGAIPVSISAKLNDEKIYCEINIDLTSTLEQVIYVTLGTDDFPEAGTESRSFTDDLYVTINGEIAGPMEATINVAEQADGKYTFSLKNFVLSADGEAMPIGNVEVADIDATEEADGLHLEKTADVMIEAGDDPNYDYWMGPTLCEAIGAIPVSVSAVMTDEKLTADISIDLTEVLGQQIYVTFGKEPSDPSGINSVNVTTDSDAIYNLGGQRLAQPQKGINIIGGKKVLY